jgi:hypothetical protein
VTVTVTGNYCDPKKPMLKPPFSNLQFTGTCACQSPLKPLRRNWKNWISTFERNKALVSQFGEEYEVVLVGDSITEHWEGTNFGTPADAWQEVNTVFREEFTTFGGGRVDAVALGIAGDQVRSEVSRMQITVCAALSCS